MKRIDWFTKVMLAAIAAGVWVLILRPVFTPGDVRAAGEAEAPAPKVLRAEGFEVVDSQGKVCAALGLKSDGTSALALRDKDGKGRAVLGTTELETIRTGESGKTAESSLVLFDKDGKGLWQAPP